MSENRIENTQVANSETNPPQPEEMDPLAQLGFTIDKKYRPWIVMGGVFLVTAGGPIVAPLTGTAFVVGTAVLGGVTGVLALLGYHAKK